MLIASKATLRVTERTLRHLFHFSETLQDVEQFVASVLPFDSHFVASQSFWSALEHYSVEQDAREVFRYTLAMNPLDLLTVISEKAVRAALGNPRHQALFMELLFRSNAALRVSNDVVLWATQVFVPAEFNLIDILLACDSTPRQFSLTDLEKILISGCSSQHLASLVSSDPNLKLDQDTFTMAVHAASLSDADAKMLLDRTPHMTLTMELMHAVQSAAADWAVYQVVTTNTSEQITDEILKSALATRRSFQLVTKRKPSAEPKVRRDHEWKHMSLTVRGLLNRAPDDLILSPETVELVCESPDWVLQRVLQRWPGAPLSDHALWLALRDLGRSRVLLRERPSIELSAALLSSICDGFGPANVEGIFREILTLRPNAVIPEDVLFSLTGPDWDDDKLASFQLLLTHEPQVPVTERVLEQAVALGFRSIHLLKSVLHARPSLQIKPSVICQVAYYKDSALGPEEYGKIMREALARSKGFPLGESEMLAIIAGCWPDSLGIILSERRDAVVTERVIAHLVDHRTPNWDCGANVPAFDLLLDRAGVSEARRPEWELRFPDLGGQCHHPQGEVSAPAGSSRIDSLFRNESDDEDEDDDKSESSV